MWQVLIPSDGLPPEQAQHWQLIQDENEIVNAILERDSNIVALKCVFLNGCRSLDLGKQFASKGLHVVCWETTAHDDVAVDFAEKFYKRLARDAFNHGSNGYVVGCTASEELRDIREIIGEETLILSPGLGAQGGDPESALMYGTNSNGEGLIVSSSRGINFAYEAMGVSWKEYAKASGQMAKKKRDELKAIQGRL